MFKRKKRQVPSLNTTSTADISFMLLILFLVTSSMDVDKGLSRQLPPLPLEEEQQVETTDVEERNVLRLHLDGDDQLTCNDEPLPVERLQARVETFVGSEADRQKHVIQLDADRQSSYDAYFHVQHAIVGAYRQLRDKIARRYYGHPYAQCAPEQQQALRTVVPQRVAEVNHAESARQEGGGE